MRAVALSLALVAALAPVAVAQTSPEERVARREARAAAMAQIDGKLDEGVLRVCADPNNLPFSNEAGEGFENALARLVAGALGAELEYNWHAQRRGFLRQTLNAGECDVVMGLPVMDMLTTTRPYYRSGYVWVSREHDGIDVQSIKDPRLADYDIGVHLIGDDGANTPPAHVLGEQGLVDNIHGFTVYGDYRQDSPPLRMLDAVAAGDIDLAAAWGPRAGWYAKRAEVPLRVEPITDTWEYLPQVFQFAIAMGVRKGDEDTKARLDEVIVERRDEIDALLEEYGVPIF